MSEEVLWYAARVSGLMTWVLACCSLIAGLLLKSQRDESRSPAQIWAGDAQRFLGVVSIGFLAVHAVAIVTNSLFELTPLAALSGRDPAGWLAGGLILGVLAAWLLVVVELLRFVEDRLGAAGRSVTAFAALIVVVSGAAHAWSLGSDVRNPFALVVVAVVIIAMLAAASLAFGADGHAVVRPAGRNIGSDVGRPRVDAAAANPRGRPALVDATSSGGQLPRLSPLGGELPTTEPHEPAESVDGQGSAARPEIPLPGLRRSRQVARPAAPIPQISGARFVDSDPSEESTD